MDKPKGAFTTAPNNLDGESFALQAVEITVAEAATPVEIKAFRETLLGRCVASRHNAFRDSSEI